jgi:hypothetical protein
MNKRKELGVQYMQQLCQYTSFFEEIVYSSLATFILFLCVLKSRLDSRN